KPGDVFIGGNQKGFPIARFTYVDQDAKIHADARILGNGGTVIFYANDCTEYHRFTSALGG
ncbi:MAG: hypothetical protein KDK76_01000, partial [Chlamydiia bacterium]|nr:hypothetical protein [Chlamydiia bacterium]